MKPLSAPWRSLCALRPSWVLCALLSFACGTRPLGDAPRDEVDAVGVGSASHALLNAAPDERHPLVVAIGRIPEAPFCTGSALGGRLVLTAAHCVDGSLAEHLNVYVGPEAPSFQFSSRVAEIYLHPGWDRQAAVHDLAVLVLKSPLPVPPWFVAPSHMLGPEVGSALELVSFGPASRVELDYRRRATAGVVEHTQPGTLIISVPGGGACPGDSGSPAFLLQGTTQMLVGVLSRGGVECGEVATYTRVAPYAEFIEAVRAASADASRAAGESCLDDAHCATHVCVGASDDPAATYCSELCSTDSDCPAWMYCSSSGPNAGRCLFNGLTPGARGAPCNDDRDCRLGRCGGLPGACTTRCEAEGTSCGDFGLCLVDERHPGELSCAPGALVATAEASPGCSLWPRTSSSSNRWTLVLMLVGPAMLRSQRRRTRLKAAHSDESRAP